jgi:hypothetical protein
MRYPHVLVYESDGRIAELLRPEIESRKWSLREPRGVDACLRLLGSGGPSVLIVKLGKDLLRELTLLERVTWLFPDTAAIVVGDAENSLLAGLAWDLGASFVLFPPVRRPELLALLVGLIAPADGMPESSRGPASSGGGDA